MITISKPRLFYIAAITAGLMFLGQLALAAYSFWTVAFTISVLIGVVCVVHWPTVRTTGVDNVFFTDFIPGILFVIGLWAEFVALQPVPGGWLLPTIIGVFFFSFFVNSKK